MAARSCQGDSRWAGDRGEASESDGPVILMKAPDGVHFSATRLLITLSETASTNSERLNQRLKSGGKRRVEQAAAFEGRPVSSLIVSSALASAERTIREHDTMVLSQRDAEAFLEAVPDPPQPSARLLEAIAEHSRRVVSR
jgi:uncharacterized protein (DUF1778 family)